MKLYLCQKTVLRFRPKGAAFISAYTTHVPEAPRSAFVDLQGRTVAVVDQHKISDDDMIVVVQNAFAGRLKAHLQKYLPLSDTAMSAEAWNVYWDLDGTALPGKGSIVIPQKAGRLIVSEKPLDAGVSEQEFTAFRVRNGVPLQGVDFDGEMILNLDDESLVSYAKGCYLGQEIVARVHYRSSPPRRLAVKDEDECTPEQRASMTSKTRDPETGRTRGFVFDKTVAGG